MEIITATEKHIPEIIELWKEFMDFHKDVDPRFPLSSDGPANQEKHILNLLNKEDARVAVALDNGRVIGYSVIEIYNYPPIFTRQSYGFISDIAVTSDYRRKGIGEQMLTRIFEWFESMKMERIELNAAAGNQVSSSFWKKHGFKDYAHRLYLDRS